MWSILSFFSGKLFLLCSSEISSERKNEALKPDISACSEKSTKMSTDLPAIKAQLQISINTFICCSGTGSKSASKEERKDSE